MVNKSNAVTELIKDCRLAGWKKVFTRYNPSPEANELGVYTNWEDGKPFARYYDPKFVVAGQSNGVDYLFYFGQRFRYEL
jgi:hypothetical protein